LKGVLLKIMYEKGESLLFKKLLTKPKSTKKQ